ncbi:MAG: VCBS repeat-containing protein [Gemmataceae bacterium]
MIRGPIAIVVVMAVGLSAFPQSPAVGGKLERVRYNHPGLAVDLGVGLYALPLPMDYDGDGHTDLVVVCPDKPYNGTFVFRNPGTGGPMPIFEPGRRIGKAIDNARIGYVDGKPRVLTPGAEYPDFLKSGFDKPLKLSVGATVHPTKVRGNQWTYCDYDGDGTLDLIVGVGDWAEYGWDDAFDRTGRWTRGPLHGYVYLLRGLGRGEYAAPVKLEAGGQIIDVYGTPSPCFADFDGDGDLDLICGEFLDGFTYFENVGTRTQPRYAAGRRLPVRMDLQMIVPVAFDWNRDGKPDLIVGDEDGRVAFVENTGRIVDGLPEFKPPRYFQQEAADLKFGALATPFGFDWNGDGRDDIVCGNTAGYVGYFENLGGNPPKWAAPKLLEADGKVIRIQAGANGSIQGPAEAKWGYTAPVVADWDHDGRPDLIVNSILGRVVWYRNVGTRTAPKLEAARPIEVAWDGVPPKPAWNWWDPQGRELVTQWRTTPFVVDWNKDGRNDLVMLDHEGYLTFFERRVDGLLKPGRRIFDGGTFDRDHKRTASGDGPLRLNDGTAGKSGRRKFCLADWDGDGRLDLLVNSLNVSFLKGIATGDRYAFQDQGVLDTRLLAGHDTAPTIVDWDKDGIPDLLVGAEDGRLYYLHNPRAKPR